MIGFTPRSNAVLTVCLYSGILISYAGFYSSKRLCTIFPVILFVFGLFCSAELSDDALRFFWDAELIANGISPYAFLPQDLNLPVANEISELISSKNYYSVYPPILQLIYLPSSIVTAIDDKYLVLTVLFFSLHLLGFIWTSRICNRYSIYILFSFPFFLIEGIINFHAEFLMVWPLVLLCHYIHTNTFISSFILGLLASIKLWPIIITALFIRKYLSNKQKIFGYLLLTAVPLCTFFLFGFYQNLEHILNSLSLYQTKFAFFGGLHLSLANILNEEMSRTLLSVLFIFIFCFTIYQLYRMKWSFSGSLSMCLFAYFFLNPNMHPWYAIPLFVVLIFSYKRSKKWIILSAIGLILSYFNYSGNVYTNDVFIAIIGNLIFLVGIGATWKHRHLG